jgi:hypothetical protein
MIALSTSDIESLIGVRADDRHPLEIMGYDFTSEGVRRFREEKPDFLPQIRDHIRAVLLANTIFPPNTNREDPGWRTFIESSGHRYTLSTIEEIGLGRYDRFRTDYSSPEEAIESFLQQVCNPDYLPVHAKQKC